MSKIKNWLTRVSQFFKKRQLQSISDTLNYAYVNVPYYNKLFSNLSILKNEKIVISPLKDIEEIPILTKDIINKEGANMYNKNYENMDSYFNPTAGSTGVPLKFLQNKSFAANTCGVFALIKYIRTNNPYVNSLVLWGATRDVFDGKKSLKGKVIDLLNNSCTFNTALLTPRLIAEIINKINKRQPALIIAYVDSIYKLAQYAEKNNIKINQPGAIHTSAGQLHSFMRKKIESVFNCPVFDHYGSRENGSIATECSTHNGLHILADTNYVEVVNSNSMSILEQEGNILISTLHNKSMPLIRYKIEDRGIMARYQSCACGIVYPKLKSVTGRITDSFKLKSGGIVSGEYLTLTFNLVLGIEQFQIKQVSLNRIIISIVANSKYDKSVEKTILEKMKRLFGADVSITFAYVNEISLTTTGKHR